MGFDTYLPWPLADLGGGAAARELAIPTGRASQGKLKLCILSEGVMARRRDRIGRQELYTFGRVRFETDSKASAWHRVGEIHRYAVMDPAKLQATAVCW